jgi:hypothetical protein
LHFPLKLNKQIVLAVLAALLVLVLLVTVVDLHFFPEKTAGQPDVFIGVDVAYGDASAVYNVSNAVAGYANLIIIGSTEVTENTTALTNVCDYLYQRGFYFIVYVAFGNGTVIPPVGPDAMFFQKAYNRWGPKFLGAYMFDEAGGKQLDLPPNDPSRPAPVATNNSDAALQFITDVQTYLTLYKDVYYSVPQMKLYTSDFALYWYDYASGYNTVFTEFFLGSQNNQIEAALGRGAAESQGKDWGVTITFSPPPDNSSHIPPYENVTQFYDTMIQAWQNNAKYIIIFDALGPNHPPPTPYGILTTEHLNAMKNFWNYAQSHQRSVQDPAQTAYVLPTDYGYGFRGSNDTIWGLFPADSLSPKIWNDATSLIATYGLKLDIVYETKTDAVPINLPYKTLIYWNGTTIHT